ncbi:unnamed protein product [Durusdinium trenchii]|uniref:Uncharacterized protein n=1 Tax=Durusdinium trenchii TaxID=1381693 RepID=A0ABP0Q2Z2_9DINO
MGIRVVKRVSNKARAANVEMPFKKGASTKPASWKTKQKQRMLAGLAFMKAPMVIVALCTLLFNNAGLKWDKPSDHVELFAGDHAITSGEWEEAIPMDLRYDSQQQDILTDVGFSNMLYQVANLRPGGGLWAAPQCSSWIFMSLISDQYSCEREMQDINNHADRSLVPPKSTEMVVHYVDSTGKKRVKGGADMIASQSYPRSFGRAYARLRTRHLQTIRRRANEFHRRALRAQGKFDLKHNKNKLWMDHANLGPILSFLAKQR